MIDQIQILDNLYVPLKDQHIGKLRKDILSTVDVGPRFVSTYCRHKNTVVQAGGNLGIYPKIYSEIFQTVYTFEPNPLNFFCLSNNANSSNVIKFQSCLGESHNLVSVEIDQAILQKKGFNSGTYQVSGKGHIPTLKIDDLSLDSCDLIHLDIEGYEGLALKGAKETILKYKPVICLEINGLGKQYGYGKEELYTYLQSLGYKFLIQTESDYIFHYE